MKKICLYLFVSFVLLSCSDDFLKENDIEILETSIVVVPNMFQTIPIYWEKAKNAKFSIVSSPKWLNVVSVSENFENGIAYITCNAPLNEDFDKTGFYYDLMKLNVAGVGECRVEVMYVEVGNPSIQVDENITVHYNSHYGSSIYLTVSNISDGILIWKIAEYPAWITIENEDYILSRYQTRDVVLSINSQFFSSTTGILTGDIVIISNDKEKPSVTAKVSVDLRLF